MQAAPIWEPSRIGELGDSSVIHQTAKRRWIRWVEAVRSSEYGYQDCWVRIGPSGAVANGVVWYEVLQCDPFVSC